MNHRVIQPNRGFSLAELLTAMAIATVLVAVLLPIVVQSRNRARAQQCASNLRQLGSAIEQYGQDWSDRLPVLQGTAFAGSWPQPEYPDGTSATHMRFLMRKRLGSGVFRCGSDTGAPECGFAEGEGSVYTRAGSSYLPWSTVRPGKYGLCLNGAAIGGLPRPSQTMLVRDYGATWHGYRRRQGSFVYGVELANVVYADGHTSPTRVVSITTSIGQYACSVVGPASGPRALALAGKCGSGSAELSGVGVVTEAGPSGNLQIRLSGTVRTAGGVYEVDRVFTFGSSSRLETSLNQVIYWIESLVAA